MPVHLEEGACLRWFARINLDGRRRSMERGQIRPANSTSASASPAAHYGITSYYVRLDSRASRDLRLGGHTVAVYLYSLRDPRHGVD